MNIYNFLNIDNKVFIDFYHQISMNFAQGRHSSTPPSWRCWGGSCTSTRPWRTCRGTPWSQGSSSASWETCGFLSGATQRCRGRPVTSSCHSWWRCWCSCCPTWWGPWRCLWKGSSTWSWQEALGKENSITIFRGESWYSNNPSVRYSFCLEISTPRSGE